MANYLMSRAFILVKRGEGRARKWQASISFQGARETANLTGRQHTGQGQTTEKRTVSSFCRYEYV